MNVILEVSDLALANVLDGVGTQITDVPVGSDGREVGPKLVTTACDFAIAQYSSTPFPSAVKEVTPATWVYKPTYIYGISLPPGTC